MENPLTMNSKLITWIKKVCPEREQLLAARFLVCDYVGGILDLVRLFAVAGKK